MTATRTLPLDSDIGASELLSDVEDALENRDPGGRGEHDDRPLETAPRSEDEPRRDDNHAPRAGAEPDVAAQAERLRLRARIRDEEGACDSCDREDDCGVVPVAGEDERDRREHRSLADAIGGRVEERTERGGLPAGASERAVQDGED